MAPFVVEDSPLLPGPVFNREMSSTARDRRSYALRSAYGLAILAVIAAVYGASGDAQDLGRDTTRQLAANVFWALTLMQGLAVVMLTPALVAGTIAVEVERKTLHDLLTSDLSAAEIVLGKMAARLVQVGVSIAVGLPILLTSGRLGGIDARLIACLLAGTLTTTLFLGGLSALASTQSRTTRGALNLAFTLTMLWLILPSAVALLLPRSGAIGYRVNEWVAPVNEWVAWSSPFSLLLDVLPRTALSAESLAERLRSMAALQLAIGFLLATLAVLRLRPAYQGHSGGRGRPGRGAIANGRQPCGDDPMIWKELVVASSTTAQRHLGLSIGLILGGVLVWGGAEFAWPALREVWVFGYGPVKTPGSARGMFQLYLRIVATGTAMTVLLGVASDAAASLTTERERDTWISLIDTPLTGWEIVRAKILGALWGARHIAALVGLLGISGVLAGSVHPIGLMIALAELAACASFAAALGVWVSLRASNSMQAVAKTLSGLIVVNAAPTLVLIALCGVRPIALAPCAPLMFAASLASPTEVAGKPLPNRFGAFTDEPIARLWAGRALGMWLASLASIAGYAAAARALTNATCREFDAGMNRPAVLPTEEVAAVSFKKPTRRVLRRLPKVAISPVPRREERSR